jgi:hypothetical protein
MTTIILSVIFLAVTAFLVNFYSELDEDKRAFFSLQHTLRNIENIYVEKNIYDRINNIGSDSISAILPTTPVSNLIVNTENLTSQNISNINKYHDAIKLALQSNPNLDDATLTCEYLSVDSNITLEDCMEAENLKFDFIQINKDNSVNLEVPVNSKVNAHLVDYFSTKNSLDSNAITKNETIDVIDYKIDINIPVGEKTHEYNKSKLITYNKEFKKAIEKKYFYNASIALSKVIGLHEYSYATIMFETLASRIELERIENPTNITSVLEEKILNLITKSMTVNMDSISITTFKNNAIIKTYLDSKESLITTNIIEYNSIWKGI